MCVRGEGWVRASPEDVFLCCFCIHDRPKWDLMFDEGRMIEELSPTIRLSHLKFKGRWPTAPRDFVLVSSRVQDPDGTYLMGASSVEDPRAPEVKGFVRGFTRTSGYILRKATLPDGSAGTQMMYIVQMNPGGWVPKKLAEQVAVNQPLCVARIRDLVESKQAYYQQHPGELRPVLAVPTGGAKAEAIPPPSTSVTVAPVSAPRAAQPATIPAVAPASAAVTAAPTSVVTVPVTPFETAVVPVPSGPVAAVSDPSFATLSQTLVALASVSQTAAGHLQSALQAVDRLLALHEAQQQYSAQLTSLLLQTADIEARVRSAETSWDARLRKVEGPVMDFEWLSGLQRLDWRTLAGLAALFLVWPIVGNVLWSAVMRRFRRRR